MIFDCPICSSRTVSYYGTVMFRVCKACCKRLEQEGVPGASVDTEKLTALDRVREETK